jgi:hypothetical protein
MLRLEKVQYRGIRIALGLMCSTPNNALGDFSGIAPLAERFVNLNFRYLVVVFYRFDHPLKRRLEILSELNVSPLNIVSSESFTRHDFPALLATHFVGDHMERALSGVQTSVVASRELLTVTATFAASMVFLRLAL